MKKRRLGNTELQMTEISFGGADIGNLYRAMTNNAVQQTLDSVWNSDIRYFDTAPQYGHGLSEHRLGHNLQEHSREQFIISTKVGKLLIPTREKFTLDEQWFIDPLPNKIHSCYSYDSIKRSVEDSLHRLGMNYIDIVHIHDLDRIVLGNDFPQYFKQAMKLGYRALAELKAQGVIKAISMGVKEWQVCAEALKHGHFDCFMLQNNYTLLDQDALDFLDECQRKNISVLLAGPFSSGILVEGAVKGARYNHVEADQMIMQRVEKLADICKQFNVAMPAAALHFPLRHAAIASVVIGMRTVEQVKQNIAWYQTEIPEVFWQALKEQGLLPENTP